MTVEFLKREDGETIAYGLGWGLFPAELWHGEREAFHTGGTPGVSTLLYMIPDRGFAVAYQMNLESVDDRLQLAADIAVEVLNLGASAPDTGLQR